jgi:Zn-dependent protease with chaperone function
MSLVQGKDYLLDQRIPSTPRSLILLALLFVPGVYLVLLLSAILPLGMYFGIVHQLTQIPSKSGSDQSLERMIGLGAIIATSACLRGIWMTVFRKTRFELGLVIDLSREGKLESFISDICNQLGAKLPDAIILHAEPTFFVQSGKLKVLNAKIKGRILAISLPLISGLSLRQLRAVLVHEFAHFTGNDTVYSSVVLPVYVGTQESMNRLLAEINSTSKDLQGAIIGFFTKIPLFLPYLVLLLYLKLFQILDMKLSRLREKRADVISALICGSGTFSDSLRKVIRLSGSFYSLSYQQIVELLKDDKAYVNYYNTFRNSLAQSWEWSSRFEVEALAEKELAFSSHPTLQTRLNYIPNVPERYNDTEHATSLFINLESYEKVLTEAYTEYVSLVSHAEIQNSKQIKLPNPTRPVASVKCPNCYMRTYQGTHCHVCGKPL